MNNAYQCAKHMSKLNAFDAQELRRYEKKCVKKAKKQERTNFPKWDLRRRDAYGERLLLRKEQRLLFLARGYMVNKNYLDIENSVREGNEVNARDLQHEVNSWDIPATQADIEDWLGQNE